MKGSCTDRWPVTEVSVLQAGNLARTSGGQVQTSVSVTGHCHTVKGMLICQSRNCRACNRVVKVLLVIAFAILKSKYVYSEIEEVWNKQWILMDLCLFNLNCDNKFILFVGTAAENKS